MSHAGGVLNECLGVAQAYSSGHQGEAIHEGHAGFLATRNSQAINPAKAVMWRHASSWKDEFTRPG